MAARLEELTPRVEVRGVTPAGAGRPKDALVTSWPEIERQAGRARASAQETLLR